MSRKRRPGDAVAARRPHPLPYCAGTVVCRSALGVFGSLCGGGQSDGRRPADRRRRERFDGAPRDWAALPIPDGRVVVGLDGGYVRDWNERKSNFEVIVGWAMPQDGPSRYLGVVHGLDRRPKRRLMDLLESQGVQANQDITFLTDGGKEILALTEQISPCDEHVLDWFHVTMKITVLGQFVKGRAALDEQAGARLAKDLARIKWKLLLTQVLNA